MSGSQSGRIAAGTLSPGASGTSNTSAAIAGSTVSRSPGRSTAMSPTWSSVPVVPAPAWISATAGASSIGVCTKTIRLEASAAISVAAARNSIE